MDMKLETLKEGAREEFEKVSRLTSNPIPVDYGVVDGAFYEIYRGHLETFINSIADRIYVAGIEKGRDEAVHYIYQHSKSGHYEEHDVSYDYQEVPDSVLKEARSHPQIPT